MAKEQIGAADERAERLVADAVAAAKAAPDADPADAFTDVWADGVPHGGRSAPITYREAVAEGIAREMRRDDTVVCLGEDIGAAEGVFKTTVGLFQEFGPRRVGTPRSPSRRSSVRRWARR